MWTEEKLADREAAMLRPHPLPPNQPWGSDLVVAQGTKAAWAELYRLARLGLAAEQVKGLLPIPAEELSHHDIDLVQAFYSHPAWRKNG